MIPLDSGRIESLRLLQLRVNIPGYSSPYGSDQIHSAVVQSWGRDDHLHDETPVFSVSGSLHQPHGNLARETSKLVVSSLRNNHDGLNLRDDAGTTCSVGNGQAQLPESDGVSRLTELLAHLPHTDCGLGELPRQVASLFLVVVVVVRITVNRFVVAVEQAFSRSRG